MAQEFNRKTLTLVVAQICQTIGWHSINSTPLELMVDLLHRYLFEVGKNAHQYAEQLGHTVPDLDDLGLAFQEMGVNLEELQEYVQYVDSVPFVHHVPKFPIPRESHLNFLKPGSREVVTRPVHVHEYLPPMHPELENEAAEEYPNKNSPLTVDTASPGPSSGPNSGGGSTSPLSSSKLNGSNNNNNNPFKRPGDPSSIDSPALKRARLMMEEEGRPLREISSVMMTTSGFLSPAREGKLPESRTPLQPSDSRSNSPQPAHYPSVPPEVNKPEKKLKKILPKKITDSIKRIDKENKKKENKESVVDDLHVDDTNVAKLVSMKELSKLKALKPGAIKMTQQPGTSNSVSTYKIPKVSANKSAVKKQNSPKPQKIQKVNHMPLWMGPAKSPPSPDRDEFFDGGEHPGVVTKIPSAPDKQKLNIFKKISKVKEEKPDRTEKIEKTSGSPGKDPKPVGWFMDEEFRKEQLRSSQIDVCIESVIQRGLEESESKQKDKDMSISSDSFVDVDGNYTKSPPCSLENDVSRPDTPTAPKTPEIAHTLLAKEESRRKKIEKSKARKELKSKMKELSPKKIKSEPSDDEFPERPKTPEVKLDMKPFPYGNFPPHPGLIPPILENQHLDVHSFLQSPTRDCSDLPEKPVTPGTGIGINSTHTLINTPSLLPSFFNSSPASMTSTPSHPTTPGGNDVPLTPGSSLSTVSALQKKYLEGKGNSILKKKEHKKDKKDKKDKLRIKKKKDKKDKNKDKEKSIKKKAKVLKKIKDKIDKDLKNIDKNKDKNKEKKKEKKKKDEGDPTSPHQQQLLVTEELGVPKLTLRLGPDSPRPPTPELPIPTAPKIVIKPVKKPITEEERMMKAGIPPPPPLFSSSHVIESESYRREKEREREREKEEREKLERERELEREKQHEIEKERERERERDREREREKEIEWERERARLNELDAHSQILSSAGRPSKPKSSKTNKQLLSSTLPFTSVLPSSPNPHPPSSIPNTTKSKKSSSKKEKSLKKSEKPASPSAPASSVPAAPVVSSSSDGSSVAFSSEQLASGVVFVKQGQLKLAAAKAPHTLPPEDSQPNSQAARQSKRNENDRDLVVDAMGNKIWICPSCKGPDDGRPMIGCDDCDAWYHWVCVNIQVPPDENENWYCRYCIVKKSESTERKKKKKSRKKPKVSLT